MGLDPGRVVDNDLQAALEQLERDARNQSFFRYVSRPVQVKFPAVANTPIDVLHGLGTVPDGVLQLDMLTGGGLVTRQPGAQWTPTMARLQCSSASSVAVVGFFVYREAPKDVTP